jgi:CheY-like chemotaxis protein
MNIDFVQGEPLKILFVEDDPAHAELVKRSLEDHRVVNQIYHLFDGEEALDFLFGRNKYIEPETRFTPHLILLDLRLPKIDGLEVLKKVKTSNTLRKIPVVILTTSEAEKDVAQAYDNYANSYLVKPLDFDKFSQLIELMGFYWLLWNHQR